MKSLATFRSTERRRRRRRAMTILEVSIALVIATSAAVAVVQLVTVANQQRRAARYRQLALLEVANQAERVALLKWDESTPDKLTSWQPSALLSAELPIARCRVRVTDGDEALVTRRIDLSVSWTDPTGQPLAPVKLTIWKHQAAEPR